MLGMVSRLEEVPMQLTQEQKAAEFRALHEGEAFIIPNPWDVGSAQVLGALGFKALATTSSGFAFTLGRTDGGASLDEVIEHVRLLDRSTTLPVSVDLENGYGPDPEAAATAIARGRGRSRRRIDRGLRSRERDLRARSRARTSGGSQRGRATAELSVHAYGAGREPHPREPGSGGHHRPAAGLRASRRRCALRTRTSEW